MTHALASESPAPLLTVSQAAERLGVSKSYVYLLIRGGELESISLPPARSGARKTRVPRRIDPQRLEEFIERSRVAPATS